jgi:2'-5' RNA ligase
VRWVAPEGIHLTLRFLGEVDEARLDELGAALEQAVAGREAPRLAPGSLGAFPSLRRPRVIWIGLEEDGRRLEPLHVAVEGAARLLGWPAETRAFRPHLTLGRVRDPRRGVPPELVQALAAERVATWPSSPQRCVALMRSHLSPHGARYEELRTWQLDA